VKGAAVCLALLLAGCGPAWRPKQASFSLEDCEVQATVPPPEEWRWQAEPRPVLSPSASGWDAIDALNPSVVRWNGRFYNLYSGFDGRAWHTGLATSTDGRAWQKSAANPVLSPIASSWEGDYIAANGSTLHDGREFLYWYQGGRPPRLGLARSADAESLRRHGPPVLEPGPAGSWDEAGVADPYVIRCRANYYMYYLGQNRRAVQRLGVARSADGVSWQKFIDNPVLDLGPPGAFDERGLGEPAVFRGAAGFYMIYAGRNASENRRLGAARSPDGVRWQRAALPRPISGDQPWNSRVVCDPTVLADGGKLWLWFGGGDLPSPDHNLHGQIGLATLEIPGPQQR